MSRSRLLTAGKNSRIEQTVFIVVFIIITGLSFFYFSPIGRPFDFFDFLDQRSFCRFLFYRVDPYTQIGVETSAVPQVKPIGIGWNTTPWGILLGNLFYPGFLPLIYAKMSYTVLVILSVSALTVIGSDILSKHSKTSVIAFFTAAVFSEYSLLCCSFGNAGVIICAFIVIAVFLCDKHPIISGILLSFAMVKPQITLIVCFGLLLRKKIKTLICASSIVIASWGIVSVILMKSPFALLKEFIDANTDDGDFRCGFLHFLYSYFKMDSALVSAICMLLCVLVVLFFFMKYSKSYSADPENEWIIYAVPCLLATVWSHNWPRSSDNYILILPEALLILFIFKQKSIVNKFLCFILLIYISFKYNIVILLEFAFCQLFNSKYLFNVFDPNSCYDIGAFIVSIIISVIIIRQKKLLNQKEVPYGTDPQ